MFDALHVFPEDPARGNYNDKNTYNEIDIFGSKRGKEKCWQLVVLSRQAIQRGHVLKKIEIKMRSTRHFGWEGPEMKCSSDGEKRTRNCRCRLTKMLATNNMKKGGSANNTNLL